MRLMEAVGSENDSPILVFTIASPQRLQYSVVKRMRSWMNWGSSNVSSSIISGFRMSIAIVHGPTATAPTAVGNLAATSPSHSSRKPRALQWIGDLQTRQRALVFLEDVRLDGRDDVIRVLDPTAGRLGLFGKIVVGEHHVGLVPIVVVEHRLDGFRRVRAVLLDRESVQRAGEGGDDRVDRHPIGEAPLV